MENKPLMPKATAIWLIDNTALTFKQIAQYTSLHPLEIKSIADGDMANNIQGMNPIISGQLTKEEIERCEKDATAQLKSKELPHALKKIKKKKISKYTPLSKRQDKPDAIHFLLNKFPILTDAQIVRLIGTTKTTIASIREKRHWKMDTMKNIDPVIAGFCTQYELDKAVEKSELKYGKNIPKDIENDDHTPSDTLRDPGIFDPLA